MQHGATALGSIHVTFWGGWRMASRAEGGWTADNEPCFLLLLVRGLPLKLVGTGSRGVELTATVAAVYDAC